MFRISIITTVLFLGLFANGQILFVVAKDFNATTAIMKSYAFDGNRYVQVYSDSVVNLGRNGLGWGDGYANLVFDPSEPIKHEGDGKAPAGVFELSEAFGYATSAKTKLPYMQADSDLICIDDANDPRYNQILHVRPQQRAKSFEWMRRHDDLYEIGVVVRHNPQNLPRHGSCIFLHVQKDFDAPSAGCTTMPKAKLSQLLNWLDPKQHPLLIQIPHSYCDQVREKYIGLECSDPD